MNLRQILVLSRPRFWVYEFGTFVFGMLAAYVSWGQVITPLTLAFGLYFLIPANILIYGINDIYDYETDLLNEKKVKYEALLYPKNHPTVWRWILLTNVPFLVLLPLVSSRAIIAFLLFIFFATFYSAKPIRAKARPVIDSLFSASHYVVTGVFGYFLVGGEGVPWWGIAAGILWAVAMHAYSAIPDIKADKLAKLKTVAILIGGRATAYICAVLYIVAAGIAAWLIGSVIPLLYGLVYVALMFWSARLIHDNTRLLRVYSWFPWINLVGGAVISITLLLGHPFVGL